MKRIAVLGATGSIGQSTLDLVARHSDQFRASVLTAHRQVEPMLALCAQFHPSLVVMTDPEAATRLRQAIKDQAWAGGIEVADGSEALTECVSRDDVDMVVAGIVGAAGLSAAIGAARHGKTILLANKEALVMAGALMVNAAREGGATVLPIDSEHNAIFQCLGDQYRCFSTPAGVTRLLLTASGGPFRTWAKEQIFSATVRQAITHPNWSMGKKISVDSATMMNKGLELIEAHWLFAMPESRIDVVIHPQSVVHSMVEFADGSTLAQLGAPDMRTPIACAMSWPKRIVTPVSRLDWTAQRQLDFEPPDHDRFPSLSLARDSLRSGGSASAVMNAANEVAVAAFLEERIRFGHIFEVVSDTLEALSGVATTVPESVEALLAMDVLARDHALAQCERKRL
ncbi:MAG: 1-deoxy-D-xylulose-5-phosphate reductoisomerase [Burkholderiaceae bacterium]